MACCGSQYHFIYYGACIFRIFFQVIAECFTHSHFHRSHYLGISELCFGLSFELRFGHFDGDNRCQSLAEVIAADFYFCFFELFEQFVVFGVFFQRTCKSASETGQVSSSLNGVDIIHIRVNIFIVRGIVKHGNFYRCAVFLGRNVDDVVNQVFTAFVDVGNKFFQSFAGEECFTYEISILIFLAFIGEREGDSGVEVSQFAQTVGQHFVFIHRLDKYGSIGQESYFSALICSISDKFYIKLGVPAGVLLNVHFFVTGHFHPHERRKCIHTRNAYPVKSS